MHPDAPYLAVIATPVVFLGVFADPHLVLQELMSPEFTTLLPPQSATPGP